MPRWAASTADYLKSELNEYEYINHDGYRILHTPEGEFHAEDVAFALMTHQWPTGRVEFVNGDKLDCRWSNLRDTGVGTPASFAD